MIRTTWLTVLAVLAVVLLTACPGRGVKPAGPGGGGGGGASGSLTSDEVVDAARRAIEQWRQAYEVRSVEALAPLYAHAPDLVVVQQGRPLIGWTQVEPYLQTSLGRAKDVHIRLRDVVVAALGAGGATASAFMTREVSDGVTTVTEDGVLTLALRQEGDAWVVVSEHYSYPPRQ